MRPCTPFRKAATVVMVNSVRTVTLRVTVAVAAAAAEPGTAVLPASFTDAGALVYAPAVPVIAALEHVRVVAAATHAIGAGNTPAAGAPAAGGAVNAYAPSPEFAVTVYTSEVKPTPPYVRPNTASGIGSLKFAVMLSGGLIVRLVAAVLETAPTVSAVVNAGTAAFPVSPASNVNPVGPPAAPAAAEVSVTGVATGTATVVGHAATADGLVVNPAGKAPVLTHQL